MRVITGFARGRKLKALDGESVRPTGDRVKEAVFSIIQFELEGRSFLDLFAGSGQMGIEALSRGAASCVFVEKDKDAYSVIKDNLAHTKLEESAKVLNTDALAFIQTTDSVFDIIYIDPPYDTDLIDQALPLAAQKLAAGGIILCEIKYRRELPERVGNLKLYRTYKYGKTSLVTYRHDQND
ncbi:MAG TPA: 16S rRNA (guanine(966)-N(2))-methyltransferase RsmD [Clostridiales bacterium]|nr:16S rRNA (guanine(966)-N(2))-methyltransferase RsmD [Clostridiales bacterium]